MHTSFLPSFRLSHRTQDILVNLNRTFIDVDVNFHYFWLFIKKNIRLRKLSTTEQYKFE